MPPGGYVGRPDKTAKQNQHRFYYVVRRHGISRKDLGVVARRGVPIQPEVCAPLRGLTDDEARALDEAVEPWIA